MSDVRSVSVSLAQSGNARASFLTSWIERLLRRIAFGSISLVLPNGERLTRAGANPGPDAKLVIHRWRTVWRLITGGELAFAQAYIDGDWLTPDLLAVLAFGARNEAALSAPIAGSAVMRVLNRVRHWRRRNTRRGSRRNIAAHYDLGNAFYALWLDRGMNYSSALFSAEDQTLEAAQDAKLDRAAALLDASHGEHVLEIGCGWGSLAERMAANCKVTGVTLSTEQLAHARQRLSRSGLTADLRLQDYRDIAGRYDRIVSIEMIEAVGERYWPVYFAKLHDLLADGGTVVLQAITMEERRFAYYRGQPDFIQRYIFPGGMLPTIDIIRREAAKAGLAMVAQETFGQSYALTLEHWRARFMAAWPAIEPLGFDAAFKRMWEYYLCYCEVGFHDGAIDVGFFKFVRNDAAA